MVYRNTHPNSVKSQTYYVFIEQGRAAALAFGQQLKVRNDRLRRWLDQEFISPTKPSKQNQSRHRYANASENG
jgi:transposase